ncbi:lantibiotic dehydratase [Saccharothrix obliqua]|uniref:lantibiotic dehydratase n=1 Tax=Saccharothrix obliqua TaxID=2861747 RepID=UPI001C5F1B85|nr:lantibiotic dehydratase [Saccharothrix obliqua]MBW4722282.1 lantibiotic dehydratase [Saccharothrix obliqua]
MELAAGWQWNGVGLLRVSTDPGDLDLPDDLDLSDAASSSAWMKRVWDRDDIRMALTAVSPALCRQIDAIVAASGPDASRVRRAATALAAYLLRWQRRSTPLGPLAGIGPARIGNQAKVRTGAAHRLSVRADSGWLAEVSARLFRCRELLERLPVVANNATSVRGGRLVVPGMVPHDTPSAEALTEVSVRATRPAIVALKAAATPVIFGDLRRQLADRFPTATSIQVDTVLHGLLDQQFLITALHIPMTEPNALDAVCDVLQAADAENIPEIARLVAELYGIRDALTGGPVAAVPPEVANRMTAIAPTGRTPLLVDTIADCEAVLPEAVAREARDAVDVLYRLSPHLGGFPAWREYQTAFRARYGTGALVPVLDLVADSGLGLPAGYIGSGRDRGPRQMSERDDKLLTLVQQASMTGGEIVLTADLVEHLASAPLDPQRLPGRAEVAFSIRAGSPEEMAAGRFVLELTGTPRPASSMAARTAHLLPATDLAEIRRTFEDTGPDTVPAQLSFAPRWRRSENVARTSMLAPAVIPIAEHRTPGPGVIDLADLAVTADGPDLHLIQSSTGKRVVPHVASALEATNHTAPLARFLSEVATACFPTYGAFAFGAAGAMPYLPRVRYRRTILSPARWQITAEQLPARGAAWELWDAELSTWLTRWRVPDHIAVVDHDRVQPIDLRHRAHRMLLRARLNRGGRLELRECAAPAELAWIGRAHEILLILSRTRQPKPTAPRVTAPMPVVDTADLHLPAASSILALRLHAHPDRFDEIITDHLPALLDSFGPNPPAWWFHRHRDLSDHRASQHLATFLHLADTQRFADAAENAATWAGRLHRVRLASGLTLADWQPPTGRYGHGTALNTALHAFAADSAAALTQIKAARVTGLPPDAIAAASFLDLATALAGDPISGRAWLLHEIDQTSGHLDPELRDHTTALADRLDPLAGTEAGQAVIHAWSLRTHAIADYAAALSEQRDPITVLRPLLHLHHLRAIGTQPESEAVIGRLARILALRQQAHSRTSR